MHLYYIILYLPFLLNQSSRVADVLSGKRILEPAAARSQPIYRPGNLIHLQRSPEFPSPVITNTIPIQIHHPHRAIFIQSIPQFFCFRGSDLVSLQIHHLKSLVGFQRLCYFMCSCISNIGSCSAICFMD